MNIDKLTNKFVMWGEKRRLKKMRKALKNFAETYNQIKPQLERLRTLYVYLDRLIETQDKEYAKHKGHNATGERIKHGATQVASKPHPAKAV